MYSIFLFDNPIDDLNTELGVESICSGKYGRELILLLVGIVIFDKSAINNPDCTSSKLLIDY